MPFAAAAAVAGGAASIIGGNSAANAQKKASNNAIAEQDKMYQQDTSNAQPYMNAGSNAVNLQNQYLAGNTSGFENSPDYQFALSQGEKASTAGAAANGNLWGGGQTADAISLGQGLATQYANNYWNKISGVAGQGLSATNALAGVGTNTANQISGQYNNIGQSQASNDVNTANTIGNITNQAANLYGQQQATQSSYGSGSGNYAPSSSNPYGVTYSNTNPLG
jgi:hypothetical protein